MATYRQPKLLALVNESRVISRRRVWIARIIVGVAVLSALPGALVTGSPAGLVGSLIGFIVGASLLFSGAYRVLSTKKSEVNKELLPTDEESDIAYCPECGLNLAMGVDECQRCGWSSSNEVREANQSESI